MPSTSSFLLGQVDYAVARGNHFFNERMEICEKLKRGNRDEGGFLMRELMRELNEEGYWIIESSPPENGQNFPQYLVDDKDTFVALPGSNWKKGSYYCNRDDDGRLAYGASILIWDRENLLWHEILAGDQ